MQRAIKRMDYIDALRGIAAAGVVAAHAWWIFPNAPWRLNYVAGLGAHGVQLFFMLSAVTLSTSWHARMGVEANPIAAFYVRRLFRIAPIFWIAILFYGVAANWQSQFYDPGLVNRRAILMTAVFAHGWSPQYINAVVPGGWSIACEMTFYVALPLLMKVLTDLRRSVIFLIASIFVALTANQIAQAIFEPGLLLSRFLYWWLPNQLPSFAFGFVTYHLLAWAKSAKPATVMALFAIPLILFAYLGWKPLPYYGTLAEPAFWRDLIASTAFMALILALRARAVSLLVNPVTRHLGKVSFSSYLTQFALIDAVILLFGKSEASGFLALPLFVFVYAGIVAINTVIATVTFNAVEKPMIRLGGSLARRVGSPIPAVAPDQAL